MRVVILVPWRTDDGFRERVWQVCRRRWEHLFPDWPIYEGVSPDGPFNRSAAINDAAKQAKDWDVALIIDADVMLPSKNVRKAVERTSKTGRVTWAHRRWRGISQEATERLFTPRGAEGALGPGGVEASDFTNADIDLIVEKTTRLSWSCCMAVRRDAWDRIGGFDERFVGWGFDDSAFAAVAGALVGWDRIEGDVLNLWHPRTPGSGKADRDNRNRHTAQALANGRLGMRYMVALRRDHGLTDRSEPSGREELERDIANLRKQDQKFAADQTTAERERFDGWWPTIAELRDSAVEYRTDRPKGSVTVVVHTGGQAERWPERREYLARSMASLTEQVSGPITQRVVYDCWGDAAVRSEIEAMVQPLGFYVVGPTPEVVAGWRTDPRDWFEFASGMQSMFGYLRKRATGDYVLQVEDDFVYERPVDLAEMMDVLARNPHLVQVALLRDPCYGDEADTVAIGNILGWPRPAFTFREGWFEHRQFFTLNPTLIRKSLTERTWPSGHHSETLFGKAVLADKRARAAFMGDGSEPWIRHIGEVRAGVGY